MDALSWLAAAVAVCSAATAAVLGYWQQRRIRKVERLDYMDRYSASLAWATFDLQSRLFNILTGHERDTTPGPARGYLTIFLVHGTEREAELARRSTVFVLAEYLGWVEILRRDLQFLDLGNSGENRKVVTQLYRISETFNGSFNQHDALRLFRIQQRAIGGVMIHPDSEPGRRRCLDYAEFCARLDTDSAFAAWFAELLADVDEIAEDAVPALARLRALQQQLVELIDLLDPDAARFPQFHRKVYGDVAGNSGS
ncbi:hypothetical protein ACFV9W_24305 [Streptomyces sp. NPDC059897]|uniref:hypothetical protein n=1 Tax=Streptomyces sp. NPDC059897 TaxID=3346994 RepID=UPI0036642E87